MNADLFTYQADTDKTHTRENNAVSQKILDVNRVKLSSQVIKVLKLLTYGYNNEAGVKVYHLDFATAYTVFGIGDIRRRICDLEEPDKFGLTIARTYEKPSGKVTYSLDEFEKIKAMQILNELKK